MKIVALPFFIVWINNAECSGTFFRGSSGDKKHPAANLQNMMTEEFHECSSKAENICRVDSPSKNDGGVNKARKDANSLSNTSQSWKKDPLGECFWSRATFIAFRIFETRKNIFLISHLVLEN